MNIEYYTYKNAINLANTKPYVLLAEKVQDIDTMSDWDIAEAKYKVPPKEI